MEKKEAVAETVERIWGNHELFRPSHSDGELVEALAELGYVGDGKEAVREARVRFEEELEAFIMGSPPCLKN